MKTIIKITAAILSIPVLFLAFVAAQIYFYDADSENVTADAALVLGAAVWGERLSPVFAERVNHAVELYRAGRVRKIIFTGGRGNEDEETESAAARRYALAKGVPARDILIEDKSTSTYENLAFSKSIVEAAGVKKILLVSDPLHLKRSVEIAKTLGYDVVPSATPTTRYRGLTSRIKLLAQETYFYAVYLIGSLFASAS